MEDIIQISEEKTDLLLTKYYNQDIISVCILKLTKHLKKQIVTSHNLLVAGSGHIERLYSIKSILPDNFEIYFFLPVVAPDYLSSDKEFVDSFHFVKKLLWHLKSFDLEKLKKEIVFLPAETIFLEVTLNSFFINAHPYENLFTSQQIFMNKI